MASQKAQEELSPREKVVQVLRDSLADVEARIEQANGEREALEEMLKKAESMSELPAALSEGFSPVRPGQYQGMPRSMAMEDYLRLSPRGVVPIRKLVADLLKGGVSAGKPRGKKTNPPDILAHNLKITVQNRPKSFQYDPETDTISLAPGHNSVDHQRKRRP